MIVAGLKGGLGNQMFQYAAGYRLAHDLKMPFRTDTRTLADKTRPYALNGFCIEGLPLTEEEQKTVKRPPRLPARLARFAGILRYFPHRKSLAFVQEKHFHFNPSVLKISSPSYLDGYWQTEKYFASVLDLIRRQFQLVEPMRATRSVIAGLIKEKGASSISVHVRRGDYVTSPTTNAFHGTCTPEWYERTMRLLSESVENPHFFVFSDDPEWSRAHLPSLWPMSFIEPQTDKRDFEDMHLMALCRHHIIANSSFSWWGAWLNSAQDKRVIAPAKWFASARHDTRDLIPETWVKV
jgi:hypothetical protein